MYVTWITLVVLLANQCRPYVRCHLIDVDSKKGRSLHRKHIQTPSASALTICKHDHVRTTREVVHYLCIKWRSDRSSKSDWTDSRGLMRSHHEWIIRANLTASSQPPWRTCISPDQRVTRSRQEKHQTCPKAWATRDFGEVNRWVFTEAKFLVVFDCGCIRKDVFLTWGVPDTVKAVATVWPRSCYPVFSYTVTGWPRIWYCKLMYNG